MITAIHGLIYNNFSPGQPNFSQILKCPTGQINPEVLVFTIFTSTSNTNRTISTISTVRTWEAQMKFPKGRRRGFQINQQFHGRGMTIFFSGTTTRRLIISS